MESGGLEKNWSPPKGYDSIHLRTIKSDKIALPSFHKRPGDEVTAACDGFTGEFQNQVSLRFLQIIGISGVHIHGAAETCKRGSLDCGLERGS